MKDIAWLPAGYDLAEANSFRRPFHTFLVKVATLCNLNCGYCYVYNMPDKSYKWKPKFLEPDIAIIAADRIQEHVLSHELKDVTIIFHGGEPLLAGQKRLVDLIEIFNTRISCQINWGMQTNGVLLTEDYLPLIEENQISLGISIDGSKEHNDKHRPFHNGNSSFDATVAAINLIRSRPNSDKLLGGVLSVIDLTYSPKNLLDFIVSLDLKSMNPILPDGHNDALPPGKDSLNDIGYGLWLSELFELWFHEYQDLSIPYFDQIIELMMGGISSAEEIGAQSVDLVVIESNGDMEAVDTLKVVGRKATSLGLNIKDSSFDAALDHPAIYSRMAGFSGLCQECKNCEFLKNCGGGYIPHRYSTANGFINPSVYCQDLKYLFAIINAKIFK